MALKNIRTQFLPDFIKAIEFNIKTGHRRPVYGEGGPGMGKSEAIQALATKLFGGKNYDGNLTQAQIDTGTFGRGFVDLRLTTMSETDIGIPFPNEEKTAFILLQNGMFPTVERDGSHGILILDELPQASPTVRTSFFQLLTDFRLGTYILPKGWFIVALGNREEDGGAFTGLEPPMLDRFEKHSLLPDYKGWKNSYALPHGVNGILMTYLEKNPSDFYTYEGEKTDEGTVFSTARSWTAVGDLLDNADREMLLNNEGEYDWFWDKINGEVGLANTSRLVIYARIGSNMVDPDKVLEGNFDHMPVSEEEKFMVLTSLTAKVARELVNVESVDDINAVQSKHLTNCFDYFMRLGKDDPTLVVIAIGEMKVANKAIGEFFMSEYSTPESDAFVDEHSQLFV